MEVSSLKSLRLAAVVLQHGDPVSKLYVPPLLFVFSPRPKPIASLRCENYRTLLRTWGSSRAWLAASALSWRARATASTADIHPVVCLALLLVSEQAALATETSEHAAGEVLVGVVVRLRGLESLLLLRLLLRGSLFTFRRDGSGCARRDTSRPRGRNAGIRDAILALLSLS